MARSLLRMLKSRSLRRYEMRQVVVSLANGGGVRGTLDRVYPDHVVVVGASLVRQGPSGAEAIPSDGAVVVPLASVMALALAPAGAS